jgi:ATP-dependent Clp protease ATP-binding subunit ClpA
MKVIQLADQEAQRLGHEYIGTEHILLGLVRQDAGVATVVLTKLDVRADKVIREVEKIVQHVPHPRPVLGRLPQTPRAKKVIEYAIEEARRLHQNYVGTEHLLIGLIQEDQGVAAQVVMNLGLTLDAVRDEVSKLREPVPGEIAEPTPPAAPEPGPHPNVLSYAQLGAFHTLIRELTDQRDAFVDQQKFEEAARTRDGIDLLRRTLALLEGRTP